jgi:hypothetical protein
MEKDTEGTKRAPAGSPEGMTKWNELVVRARKDATFKSRLMANPATVLNENGLTVPDGVEIRIVENTDRVFYLTLPARPASVLGDLPSREPESVVGGWVASEGWDEVPLGIKGRTPPKKF